MIGVRLEPVDTLFFRDGTPFSADASPQEDVASLFPPHPTTVTGAIRAALACCNGWNGHGRWPERLNPVLGNGPHDLGELVTTGPFLLRDAQPLFPVPRHLLGSLDGDGWNPRLLLRPGSGVTCDLGGDVRLPEAPAAIEGAETCKPGDGEWLTQAGMEKVLRGELPAKSEVVSGHSLWSEEPRIGLERNRNTRTAQEGQLYSTRHVRLKRGVSLGMRITGVPSEWKLPTSRLIPLGGESRLVACYDWNDRLALNTPLSANAPNSRLTVIAVTPLDLDESVYCGQRPLEVPGGVTAKVVSACLNRPQRIGGWDSLARRPLPLRSVLSPGSVLFCETDEPQRFVDASTAPDGWTQIGSRQAWGFGLAALGVWPDS